MHGHVELGLDPTNPRTRCAVLVNGAGSVLAGLRQVQLQRWEARGMVLAGIEKSIDRCRAGGRQSWFVTFPGALTLMRRVAFRHREEGALV